MDDQKVNTPASQEGTEEAQETVASETVIEAGEMSTGWSVKWDPTALGKLRVRSRCLSHRGEDETGAKGSR